MFDLASFGKAFGVLWIFFLTPSWLKFHIGLWLWRYTRTIVHSISHWTYKSKPRPKEPNYTPTDVTVVIPTIHNAPEELRPQLRSILDCKPYEMIMITTRDKETALRKLAKSLQSDTGAKVRVLCTDIANKRLQVCKALPEVTTKITIMADDDDPKIGGVGTCQRVRRKRTASWSHNVWNWLGAAYIERRNFETSATHNIDGGTSCMSGRTGAYRSEILSHPDFLNAFQHERWGKRILNADDDNFVTRWLVNHQWKTWIQYEKECEIETTLETGIKFLYQCARWARSNWRSNWTSLVRERYVITQQPWCTYALHLATFTSLAFIGDPLILLSLWWGTADWDPETRRHILLAEAAWMLFTKTIKLVGLWRRHPWDLPFYFVSVIFGYLHGLIKMYALFTLHVTSWGSRPDGDTHDNLRMAPPSDHNESVLRQLDGR
ncbi:polysaccharide synthase [Apiospora saccharicola]